MNTSNVIWRAYNGHVLIIAFLVGLFGAVMIGIQQGLANAESSVKSSLVVAAFLQNNVTDADAASLAQALKNQDPEIQSIVYTSKDQAYTEAMKDPNLAKSLILLKNNPLPASLVLHYSDRAWWERSEPTEKLRGVPLIQDIRWDARARSMFLSLHRWRLWSLRVSMFAGVILLVWAFMGLYRVLLLQGETREISFMLIIGALGGALAWGVWGVGLRTFQAELSIGKPSWIWLIPLVVGLASSLGCFGLEIRHAE
jgi:cell division protein FtsX